LCRGVTAFALDSDQTAASAGSLIVGGFQAKIYQLNQQFIPSLEAVKFMAVRALFCYCATADFPVRRSL
jgi:hypothetical protein